MSETQAVKIATESTLFQACRKAFSLGFEQALMKKRRFTKTELLESIGFYDLRGFHKKTVWESYRSGRFEAVASFDVKAKY